MLKKYILISIWLFTLSGCIGLSTVPSSVGLYSNTPGPQEVDGSNVQVVETRTVSYNYEEVEEAISKSINMLGLKIESKDKKSGKYTGGGNWNAPGQITPCATPYTFAAYIEEIDNKPTTKLTLLVDRHSYCGAGYSPEKILTNQIIGQFHKVLATF